MRKIHWIHATGVPTFQRVTASLRIALQIGALTALSAGGSAVSARLHLPVPGPIVGMAVLLAALQLRVVRAEWLDAGAGFLFRHMLLLFVPAAVGAIDHRELLGADGARVLGVVAASTLLVMTATGCAVEWAVRRRREEP